MYIYMYVYVYICIIIARGLVNATPQKMYLWGKCKIDTAP